MKRYVEASPKARQSFFLIAIVLGGLVLFMYVFDTYFPPVGSVLEQLAQMDARATYKLIAFIPIYLVFFVVAFVLAARSVRTRQWPPAGIAVPFRTQIREIRKPFKVWAYVTILICIYVTLLVILVYQRVAMHAMVQEALRASGQIP